jgi:hypothetical protein
MAIGQTDWHVTLDAAEAEVAAVLAHNRIWNCFALADLLPPFRAYSQYAIATRSDGREQAACLVLQHPAFTVISPYGANEGVAAILTRLALPEQTLIQAENQHLRLLKRCYRFTPGWRQLLRMAVTAATFVPPALSTPLPVERLTPADAAALGEFYKLSPEAHFRPDHL